MQMHTFLTAHTHTHTHFSVWRVQHGHHTEHSIILSLTSAALSHYRTLPILSLLYLPFSQTLFFSLSFTSVPPLIPPAPFSSTVYPSMPTKMNRIPQDVGGLVGRQVGWHAFTPVWYPLSLRQHVHSLKKWPQSGFNTPHMIETEKWFFTCAHWL